MHTWLLDLLVCPECRGVLRVTDDIQAKVRTTIPVSSGAITGINSRA